MDDDRWMKNVDDGDDDDDDEYTRRQLADWLPLFSLSQI